MANNEKVILDTLAYKGVFKSGVTFFQLRYFLFKGTKLNLKDFAKLLDKLCKNKLITKKNNIYFLSDIKTLDWKTRVKNSKHLIKKNSHLLNTLSGIPWIKMIAITGSVAAFNAKEDDDLDLFIVTQNKRMWITRFFVTLFLLNAKKYPNIITKDKICPNIYISENNLRWDKRKQNIYTAQEILLMQPYYYKDDMYFRFMQKNDWIENFVHNFPIAKYKSEVINIKQSKILNLVESMFFKLQKRYMHKKQTTEKVTEDLIHFNKNDSTDWVLEKHKQMIKKQ